MTFGLHFAAPRRPHGALDAALCAAALAFANDPAAGAVTTPAPPGAAAIAPPLTAIVPAPVADLPPPSPPFITAVAEAIWLSAGDGFAQAAQGINGSLGASIADIGPAQGAWVANTVLAAAGLVPRTKPGKGVLVAIADPFRVKSPSEILPAGTTLAQALAAQKLGDPGLLAIGINQKFASSTTYQTDLALRHTSGPIDVNVNVTGEQPLEGRAPMAVQYDGEALVAVVPQVELGVAAQGPLGTLQALTTQGGDQTAGPLMRLKLQHRNVSLSTDAGYDFRLNPTAGLNPDVDRFHVKVGLNISL